MSRYRFESVTYNNDELHVRVSEPDSAMHPASDLKIEFDEMSGDEVFLSIDGGPWKEITSRKENLSDMERGLVQETIYVAREQLSPEKAKRAVTILKAMFDAKKPFVDVASTTDMPPEIQELLSKHTMTSKLRDDPMFYGRKEFVMQREARENPEYAMIAISQHGALLIDAPENIKGNKDIVLAAIRSKKGHVAVIYSSASDELQEDWDVISAFIARDYNSLSTVFRLKPQLFNDPNFIAHILNGVQDPGKEYQLLRSLQEIQPSIFRDEGLVQQIIPLLDISHEGLRSYAAFVFFLSAAANLRNVALSFAQRGIFKELPMEYRGDRDIVKASLQKRISNFRYADRSLKEDKGFVMELLQGNIPDIRGIYSYLSPELQNDTDVVLKVIEKGGSIDYLSLNDAFVGRLANDKQLFLRVVPGLWMYPTDLKSLCEHLNESLATDKEVALLLAKKGGVKFLNDKFKRSRSFLKEALENGYITNEQYLNALFGLPEDEESE